MQNDHQRMEERVKELTKNAERRNPPQLELGPRSNPPPAPWSSPPPSPSPFPTPLLRHHSRACGSGRSDICMPGPVLSPLVSPKLSRTTPSLPCQGKGGWGGERTHKLEVGSGAGAGLQARRAAESCRRRGVWLALGARGPPGVFGGLRRST
jgi:hypothetical protein